MAAAYTVCAGRRICHLKCTIAPRFAWRSRREADDISGTIREKRVAKQGMGDWAASRPIPHALLASHLSLAYTQA
jgi:hypothetical protein